MHKVHLEQLLLDNYVDNSDVATSIVKVLFTPTNLSTDVAAPLPNVNGVILWMISSSITVINPGDDMACAPFII